MSIKKKTIEVQTFVCDECGQEFYFEYALTSHLKTHKQSTCSHEKLVYSLDITKQDYENACAAVSARCTTCDLTARASIPDCDHEVLKVLFEALGGRREIEEASKKAQEKARAAYEVSPKVVEAKFIAKYGRPMTDAEKQAASNIFKLGDK